MRVVKIGSLLLAICLCAGAAYADPISVVVAEYQQTQNSPCVIGNPSCNQPAGFTYFSDPNGAKPSYDYFSPIYQVRSDSVSAVGSGNLIPTTFSVGIDDNYSAGQGLEQLLFFKVYTSSSAPGSFPGTGGETAPAAGFTLALSYIGPYDIDVQNGNGFSDIVLTGFSLAPGTYVYFEASIGNNNSGMEQFFIIPEAGGGPVVPEPTTLLLLGSGLVATVGISRRMRNK